MRCSNSIERFQGHHFTTTWPATFLLKNYCELKKDEYRGPVTVLKLELSRAHTPPAMATLPL